MKGLNILDTDIHLVFSYHSIANNLSFWLRKCTSYDEYCVPTVLNGVQECWKIKVRDDLRTWWNHVGTVEVVPYAIYLSYCEPMVNWMTNECLFVSIVLYTFLHFWILNRCALNLAKLYKSSLYHLNTKISIICHIMTCHALSETSSISHSLFTSRSSTE